MSRRPRSVPELADRPFRGSAAVSAGLVTPNELRGPGWRRVHRDVHVAVDVELTQAVRARAARLVLPGAVVTGRSAAWLWDVDVDGPDGAGRAARVEVTVPPGEHRRVPGVRVRRRLLDLQHVGCVPSMRDIPVLWPEYAALELAADPARGLDESVVVLDQFCHATPVTLTRCLRAGAGWTGRGCRQLREALALADGLAESPPETRLRLALHRSPLPRPQAQYRLQDALGRVIARFDFAWPDLRLAIEYDGSTHVASSTRPERPFRLPKDRHKLNEAQRLGWRVYYVTAPDAHDMTGLVTTITEVVRARVAELGLSPR